MITNISLCSIYFNSYKIPKKSIYDNKKYNFKSNNLLIKFYTLQMFMFACSTVYFQGFVFMMSSLFITEKDKQYILICSCGWLISFYVCGIRLLKEVTIAELEGKKGFSGIWRDKTIADKLMYILNKDNTKLHLL